MGSKPGSSLDVSVIFSKPCHFSTASWTSPVSPSTLSSGRHSLDFSMSRKRVPVSHPSDGSTLGVVTSLRHDFLLHLPRFFYSILQLLYTVHNAIRARHRVSIVLRAAASGDRARFTRAKGGYNECSLPPQGGESAESPTTSPNATLGIRWSCCFDLCTICGT